MKKEKLKRIARRITAFAAAVAMAATFTFPAEIGDGLFEGFGNAIVASAAATQLDVTADNVNITASGDYIITGTSTTNTISVAADVSANITLNGVNIDVSGTDDACAFRIADDSKGNVTITLADGSENTLISGRNCAGIQKNGIGEGIGKLTIKGGTSGTGKLTATCSGDLGAGIGGGNYGSCSNIEISGGAVTANGGGYGAGIGGGRNGACSNITISGGTVTATGGGLSAGIGGGDYKSGSDIIISGGTVTANGGYMGAGIGGGYLGSGSNITITGGSVNAVPGSSANAIGGGYAGNGAVIPTLADGTTKVFLYYNGTGIDTTDVSSVTIDGVAYPTKHGSENKIYPYLSVGFHTVKIDGTEKVIYMDDSGNATEQNVLTGNDLVVYGGTSGNDYEYSGGVLTIKTATSLMIKNANTGSTTDRIEVESGISANITLAGVNIVNISDYACAFKIEDNSTGNVTITLADGTTNILKSGYQCAGLQKNGTNGSLEIKGTGTLEATGGELGAGIGGGNEKATAKITISSGIINATGNRNGAGIGGGSQSDGSYITITGGTVTATGGSNGDGIGGGENGNGSNIKIIGGSVKVSSISCTPTSNGTTSVYPLTIENPTGADVFIDGSTTPYKPSNHSAAGTSDTNLYVYLTGETHKVKIGDEETEYKFCTDKFLPVPKASDFTFTAPIAPIGYDGSEKEATVTGISGTGTVTVKYYLVGEDDSETELTNGKPVNAGTYKVKIDVDIGTSYADVQDLTAETWKFTIGKATPTVTAPTAKSRLVYNGTAQELINKGSTNFGTLLYSLDDTNYSEDIPTATDADSYTVYYKVQGDSNVNDVDAQSFTVSIGKAAVTITANSYTVKVGNPLPIFDYKVSGLVNNEALPITVDVSCPAANSDNLGTFPIRVSGAADSTNYTFTYVNGTLKITTKDIQTITADDVTLTYGDTGKKITAATDGGGAISYEVKTGDDVITVAADGTITVLKAGTATVEITAAETDDYAKTTKTITVTVNKATPTITVTASPTSDIAGKTITVTAQAENPANSTLTDVPTPTLTYKVGESGTETAFTGSFVIPEGTTIGTVITITAATAENGNYYAGTTTTKVIVTDCEHTDVAEWEKDETCHWHICNYCGAVVDKAEHTYGSWKITVPATADANGKKERSCTVCGYVQEGVVTYGGDESTGNTQNSTDPENNACHADLELTDEEIISKIPLTPEELEAIENGADLEVYMVVIDYSGNVPSADKALAESVLTGNMQIGMYIDVTLFVKVGDNDPRAVTETNGDLKITFEMPEKLINTDTNVTRKYSIIRVHSGKATILDCAYDNATGKGSFKTDRFSSYAIAYEDIEIIDEPVEPETTPAEEAAEEIKKILDDFPADNDTTAEDILETIESVVDDDVNVEITDFEKVPATEESKGRITVTIVITDNEGNTETVEKVMIIPKLSKPEKPAVTVYYPIITSGNVSVDKHTAAAGEIVNVRSDFGYDIIVTTENGRSIAKITEKGSFTMPASKVYVTAVQNETYALMATAWRQSYVYSYDAEMNKIKVSSTKKRGVIVINLGEEYAGKSFTIYSGRKSTKAKITEGEFDENGRFVFEVPDGKNYTLIVED